MSWLLEVVWNQQKGVDLIEFETCLEVVLMFSLRVHVQIVLMYM